MTGSVVAAPGSLYDLSTATEPALNTSSWQLAEHGITRQGMNLSQNQLPQGGDDAADIRDWQGLKQDAYYFLVYQIGVIALLYVVPEDISGWSEQDKKEGIRFAKYERNIKHLVWDADKAYINYLLHPYWGGTYYVRARERGFGPKEGFWFAFMLSTFYEYGAEAIFEKPSMQDMIFTPVGGAFFGEYMWNVRKRIKDRNRGVVKMSGYDRFLMVATDPLGALNRTVGRWLGHDSYVEFQPYIGRSSMVVHETDHNQFRTASESTIGVNLKLAW